MRSVIFPYSSYKGILTPIIPIQVKGTYDWIKIWTYVDSGASYSLFGTEEADRLGINYTKGKEGQMTVGDGGLIPVFFHRLKLKIGPYEVLAPIAFSEKLGVGFNLLGRDGIFTKFDVIFSDSKRKIVFKPISKLEK